MARALGCKSALSSRGSLVARVTADGRRLWLPQMDARVKADGRLNALHRYNSSVPFWPDGPCVFSRSLLPARGARKG
eukprot:2595369-Pyramimonas_sp.AAC.1